MVKEINLREERDFGQKLNASFAFVQANFKSLVKVIFLLVGPLIILGGFFFGLSYSEMMNNALAGAMETMDGYEEITNLLVSYFFLGLGSFWMQVVVYSYMAEYLDGNRNIGVEDVWKRASKKIFKGILTAFLISIMVVLGFILFIIPGIYLMIALSLAFPIIIFEDRDVFESIGRSFTLISGKWWSTLGILMIMGMIANLGSMVFGLPFIFVMILNAIFQLGDMGQIMTILFSCLLFLGTYIMSVLPALALGFQYFNLVEKKEGIGLLEKIEQLGTSQDTGNEGDY